MCVSAMDFDDSTDGELCSIDCDDYDCVFYGTPLPELDEDAPQPRARPPDQTVRDAQGRQRFHGAFTGGFSAGFFNTVDTPEGFTPAAFVSSRQNRRGNPQTQTPHDFMDEEDLGEFGIAPQRITAKTDFSGRESSSYIAKSSSFRPSVIPGQPALQDIIKPIVETVGVRILKRLGWKPGQGIGPLITHAEKKLQQKKVYGCALPEDRAAPREQEEEDEDDSVWLDKLLAPMDMDMPAIRPKSDRFGLGYSGLSRHSVLGSSDNSDALRQTHRDGKISIRGQAFGVGALEEDDDDLYTTEDMSQYDFQEQSEAHATTNSKPSQAQEPAVGGALCRPVPGFVGAQTSGENQRPGGGRLHAPPKLPASYRSDWRFTDPSRGPQTGSGRSRFLDSGLSRFHSSGSAAVSGSEARGLDRQRLSASDRSRMLAEPQERVQQEQGIASNAPRPDLDLDRTPGAPRERVEIKPFAAFPDKQRRYEAFVKLKGKGNRKALLFSSQPSSMTDAQRENEFSEFVRAAAIFLPLSGVLAERFQSAGTTADVDRAASGASAGDVQDDDPAVQAAQCGMHGRLTRRQHSWMPEPLLCKRFNVPPPRADTQSGGGGRKEKASLFDVAPVDYGSRSGANPGETRTLSIPKTSSSGSSAAAVSVERSENLQVKQIPPEEVEVKQEEPDAIQTVGTDPPQPSSRPPADLFSAIFNDTDSSDSDESVDTPSADRAPSTQTTDNTDPVLPTAPTDGGAEDRPADISPLNQPGGGGSHAVSERAEETGCGGLFDNIDLDELNRWKRRETVSATSIVPEEPTRDQVTERIKQEDPEEYGPALPPAAAPLDSRPPAAAPLDSRPRKRRRSHSSDSSADRHKKRRHKEKKRKKEQKRHRSRNSSSSDSDSDAVKILHKLHRITSKKRDKKRKKKKHSL